MLQFFRSKYVGRGGVVTFAGWLVTEFGPDIVSYRWRVAAFVLGLALLFLWAGTKGFEGLRAHTRASAAQAMAIVGIGGTVVGFVLFVAYHEFDIGPDKPPTAEEIALAQGGGDNFCYFAADFDRPKLGGGYEWQIRNKKQIPIPFFAMDRYEIVSGAEVYRGNWKPDACRPDSVDQTTADEEPIKPGTHIFRFRTVNSWEQRLEIIGGEMPRQVGVIYRGGREIWRFTNGAR